VEARKVQSILEKVLYGLIITEKAIKSNEEFNKTLVEELKKQQAETRRLLYLWKGLYPLKETVEIDINRVHY